MADPPCRHDKRRPVTSDGGSGVITSEWQEPDLCTVGHRRESTVAPGPGPGGPAQMWRTSDPKSEHQGLHLRSPERTVLHPNGWRRVRPTFAESRQGPPRHVLSTLSRLVGTVGLLDRMSANSEWPVAQ